MSEALPRVLYKFLRPEYAVGMVRDGSVRIGTLHEFRALEGDDLERGDAGEGHLRLHSDAGRRVYNSTSELPRVLQQMDIHRGPSGIATQGENAVVLDFEGPDMLIYCTSERFCKMGLGEWGGACVEITDPQRFFHALDAEVRVGMAGRGRTMGLLNVARCVYADRRHNWHQNLPPHWCLKPRRFEHQCEVRAAWTIVDGPLEPFVVCSRDVPAVCRIVDG